MNDRVARENAAAVEGANLGQRELHTMTGAPEYGDSRAEQDRMDVQADLVDQVGG